MVLLWQNVEAAPGLRDGGGEDQEADPCQGRDLGWGPSPLAELNEAPLLSIFIEAAASASKSVEETPSSLPRDENVREALSALQERISVSRAVHCPVIRRSASIGYRS